MKLIKLYTTLYELFIYTFTTYKDKVKLIHVHKICSIELM